MAVVDLHVQAPTMASSFTTRITTLSTRRAFLIHLALSILVFMTLVAIMFTFWFPGQLFFFDGGLQGLKLVAIIDLVLGPALTLMLYKPNKPRLLGDMFIIATLQLGALAYGFYTTHKMRTAAVVYAEKSFITVSAKTLQEADSKIRELGHKPANPRDINQSWPALLGSSDPAPGKYGAYLAEVFNGFPETPERSNQYKPIGTFKSQLASNALNEEKLRDLGAYESVQAVMEKRKLDPAMVQLHKFNAAYARGVVIFDPENEKILDYIAIEKTDRGVETAESPEQ